MTRTLLIGDESAIPSTAGAATSFSEATVVRLVNVSGSSAVVGVSTLVGAATTVAMTVPDGTVEFLQKRSTDVVWAKSGTVRGAKVGFTN